MYLRIESVLGKKLPKEDKPPKEVLDALHVHVDKATAEAIRQTKKFMIKEMVVVVEEIEMMPIEKKDKPHSKKLHHITILNYGIYRYYYYLCKK